ncbi:MAG: hypothetical protein HW383_497 [Candidatus Magasanikbacteria bacterium]|nr:hypothetical protein [Candidatus Magasanikbacteria bacterium]
MNHVVNKFSTNLKYAIASGFAQAARLSHANLTSWHLLYGVLKQKGSIGAYVLEKAGGKLSAAKIILDELAAESVKTIPQFGKEIQNALEKAAVIAAERHHQYIGTEHFLLALLQNQSAAINSWFKKTRLNRKAIINNLNAILQSTSKFAEVTNALGSALENEEMHRGHEHGHAHAHAGNDGRGAIIPLNPTTDKKTKKTTKTKQKSDTPALDYFAVELTSANKQNELDPVIGRDAEIERTMHILCRRTKNNPLLLGDPGVGKTAIVEGLARRIAENNAPEALADKKIFMLDLGLVVAGTIYRGEFEARLKQIIEEVRRHPDFIVFIDEIHMIIGAGASSGSMDAANLLKPALARGQMRCIGATTFDEFKKHIEADPALERRFQPVQIAEPSPEETEKILRGVSGRYAHFHNVEFAAEAIKTAVKLAVRYIPEKFLPDKAIDVLDEAAAAVKMRFPADAKTRKLRVMENSLKQTREQKDEAISREHFETAVLLKEKERLLVEACELLNEDLKLRQPPVAPVAVSDIIAAVSHMTGLPESELAQRARQETFGLAERLKTRVVGQNDTIDALVQAITRAELGLRDNRRPRASFLFVGQSGVGKTALAEALADELFHDEASFIRVDLSEFSEGYAISKLIGSPAGYVGYKDATSFTDKVKRHSYSVVLLDEVDKAHRDVTHLFLQILENGFLTDAIGKKISFRNTILIFTTTSGADIFTTPPIGFSVGDSSKGDTSKLGSEKFAGNEHSVRAHITDALNKQLGAEFVNRLDHIAVFPPLTREHLSSIVRQEMNRRLKSLNETDIRVTVNDEAIELLAERSVDPVLQGRAVRAVIQRAFDNPIADLISRRTERPLAITVERLENELNFRGQF